ncbi:MAG: hypothetical protein WAS23_02255, partial [Dokdonella sp.]|uniref:hypothetical protein n=1 Tax=Dokdonella sp. TaxID=2291710 RepID=UPI003BB0865F
LERSAFLPRLHPVVVNKLVASIEGAKLRRLRIRHIEAVFRKPGTDEGEGLTPDLLVSAHRYSNVPRPIVHLWPFKQ